MARSSTIAALAVAALLLALCADAGPASRASLGGVVAVRAPRRECTVKYIMDEAACSCFLFARAGSYPEGVKSVCQAAYKDPWAQKWRCNGYKSADGEISRDAVDEALVWTVEQCLSKPTTASRILAVPGAQGLDAPTSLDLPTRRTARLFFLPALLPIIGKVVIKTAVSAGARLAAKAAAKVAAKKAAAAAAKAAAKRAVTLAAKKAANAAAKAAGKAVKVALKAAKIAKRRAVDVAKKAQQAQRVARQIGQRLAQRAKREGLRLLRKAAKFGRKEAKRIAECVSEKAKDLKNGRDVVVELDAGTIREEVEECLKESKVICVGLESAEVVRGKKEADSLSFFADLATCLSDNRGVCVASATVKFLEKELERNEYVAEMIGCLPDSDKCAPQVAQLLIGGGLTAESAIEQAIACDDEQKEKKKGGKNKN